MYYSYYGTTCVDNEHWGSVLQTGLNIPFRYIYCLERTSIIIFLKS